jgi:hypothetical protein
VLDHNTGTAAVDVTLKWGPNNACSGTGYIRNPFFLVVAHYADGDNAPPYAGGVWNDFSEGAQNNVNLDKPNDFSSGTVTWKNVSTFSPFTLGSVNVAQAPLPVTFMSFQGRKVANGTQLTWKVAGEQNVAGYEIERKAAGGQFSKVGFVTATGNSSYTFTDAGVQKGVVFYRLKNVDNDGRFAYSTILSFKNGTGIVVLPTVVTGRTTVLHDAAGAGAWLSLSTASGQQLKVQKPQAGSLQTKVDLTGLRAGIYLLKFNDGNGTTQTTKLVKQ